MSLLYFLLSATLKGMKFYKESQQCMVGFLTYIYVICVTIIAQKEEEIEQRSGISVFHWN